VEDSQELTLQRLFLIAGGHTAFQLLWAGVKLGVFDALSREPGLTLVDIATRIDLKEYPCRVLIVGLTALGLVKKHNDRYSNAPLTEQMLVEGKAGSVAPILGWQALIVYPGLQDFVSALRQGTNVGLQRFPGNGNTLYERLASQPALEQVFHDAMSALSVQANRHLLDAYDFGRFAHVVDAGAGDGTNAIALAKRYPSLKVTVYDSEENVCRIAGQNIEAHGLSDRVFTRIGNFLTDPFPAGIDAILFCHIFTIWSMERNLEILRKCWRTLPKGGAVILFNMMSADDDSGPLSTALGSPYFLAIATGEGMLHRWTDYERAMREAGFSRTERAEGLPLNHGVLVAFKD
jgi:ubiquinone/menaquinone biosynthesis C-methylase UbiE